MNQSFKRAACFILIAAIFFAVAASGCARRARTLDSNGELIQKGEQGVKEVPFKLPERAVLKFSIRWLGFEFGSGEIRVEGIERLNGRDAYHVSLAVKSNKVIDLVYPVRDEHHTYIDVEHFHSLRYDKKLREGNYRADEAIDYDQVNHTALYFSRRNGSRKQMFIPKDVQDPFSAAFWVRAQAMKAGDEIHMPVNSDERNWDVTVRVKRATRIELGELGTFEALEIEPAAQFQGVFIRRGKFWGYMSLDRKRLPILMRSRIPVLGSVSIMLVEEEGW